MNTIVKAAAVQISPVLYSRQGTVEKIVKKIRELGNQDVQFATFPEAVVPYYPYFSFVQPAFAMGKEHQRLLEQSVTVPSAETLAIGEAAKDANMVVSIGVNERDGGSIYNTQLLFDADGTLIQRRRKITPTYHERMIWGQGDGSGLRAADSAVGRIGQLACAVDCGTVVNPDTVQAQIQSSVMFGITAALYGEITLKDGRIEQTNFDTYQMLRMNEAPVVDVHIVRSFEAPGGMGEAGTSAIVPAVANAIFAATGKRWRKLPVDTAALKQPV